MKIHLYVFLLCSGILLFACSDTCEGPDENGYYYCYNDEEESDTEDSDDYDTSDEHDEGSSIFVDILIAIFTSDSVEENEYDDTPSCMEYPGYPPCFGRSYAAGNVEVRVGSPDGHMPEWIEFYKGEFEDGVLIEILHSSHTDQTIELPAGKISAAALYVVGGDTIVAVDGTRISYSRVEYCDRICYRGEDESLDLVLGRCLSQQ